MKKIALWFSVAVMALGLAALSGCAAGPKLKDYPERQIDRPLTLPKGVASWKTLMVPGYVKDNSGSVTLFPIPYPLIWETALSDDWMLTWFPVPLAITYQASHDASHRFGVTTVLGFHTRDLGGGNTETSLDPSFAIQYRKKMASGNWAIDIDPTVQLEVGGSATRWTTSLAVGPFFQVSDTAYLKPALGVTISKGTGLFGPFYRGNLLLDQVASFSPSLAGGVVMSRQWDFDATYTYTGLGSSTGLSAHVFLMVFSHYW